MEIKRIKHYTLCEFATAHSVTVLLYDTHYYFRNKDYLKEKKVIDLHGLHVDEAVRALRNFLANAANSKFVVNQ